MPEEQTPYEKVKKANDDFHEAIDAVMENEVDVVLKAKVGSIAHGIFGSMDDINEILKAHYEPEEE